MSLVMTMLQRMGQVSLGVRARREPGAGEGDKLLMEALPLQVCGITFMLWIWRRAT